MLPKVSDAGKAGSARVASVVFSDAHLVALVRSALGRDPKVRDLPTRLNVSSCGSVVTLHGLVPTREDACYVEVAVKRVSRVQSVENKLKISA